MSNMYYIYCDDVIHIFSEYFHIDRDFIDIIDVARQWKLSKSSKSVINFIFYFFLWQTFSLYEAALQVISIFSLFDPFASLFFNCSFIPCDFLSYHLVSVSLFCLPRLLRSMTRPGLHLLSSPSSVFYLPHMSKYTKFIYHCWCWKFLPYWHTKKWTAFFVLFFSTLMACHSVMHVFPSFVYSVNISLNIVIHARTTLAHHRHIKKKNVFFIFVVLWIGREQCECNKRSERGTSAHF